MSEPTIQIDHQATLQPSPYPNPGTAPVPGATAVQPTAPQVPVDQYQPPQAAPGHPIHNGPDRFQQPDQFIQNPAVTPIEPAQPFSPLATNPAPTIPSANQPETQAPAPDQTTTSPQAQAPQQTPPQPDYFPGVTKPIPEEVVVEWEAPSRPHKKRQKQYFTTIAIFVILIGAILFFIQQFLLIGVVLAVAFLVYVLEVVPPTLVRNQITTYGIRVENNLYYWDELGRFWFVEKHGQPVLHVEVARFPGRLTLLLGEGITQKDMTDLLSEVLLHQQPPATAFERASDRLQQLIPLENEKPAA